MIGRVLLIAVLLAPLSAGALGHRGLRHRLHRHHGFVNARAMHPVARRAPPRRIDVPALAHRDRRAHFDPQRIPGLGTAWRASHQAAEGWREALAP